MGKALLEVVNDIVLEVVSRIDVVEVKDPESRKAGIKVASVDELVDKLKNEAGVI